MTESNVGDRHNNNIKEGAAAVAEEEEEETRYRWEEGRIPETEATFLSRLFFLWPVPLFRRASWLHKRGRALEHDDLLPLPDMDHGSRICPKFDEAWNRVVEKDWIRKEKEEKKARTKKKGTKKTDGSKDDDDVGGEKKDKKPKTALEEAKESGSVSLIRDAILSVIGRRLLAAGIIKFFNTALQFSFPLLLNAILKFIEDVQAGIITDDDPWHERYAGYWMSGLLFVAMASKAVTENTYFHAVYRCSYQARVAVSVSVYQKSLRLANAERQSTTLGELINLMQVDASKIEGFIPQVHVLWDGILQISGYMAILYTLIGWSCFAGLVIILAAGPLQGIIMKRLFALNRAVAGHTDSRVKVTNEALQGIQCVKMYTWEESFQRQIAENRDRELGSLRDVAYLRGFSRAYMGALPGLVAVGSFVAYALSRSDSGIEASTLFAALVAFEQIRFPLLFYPMTFALLAQARVSAARVEAFLGMKEVGNGDAHSDARYARDAGGRGEIIVRDADIYWNDPSVPAEYISDNESVAAAASENAAASDADLTDTEGGGTGSRKLVYPKAILKGVSMTVAEGELCAVVGKVASGKSTLCSAILNEAFLNRGEISLSGGVAYAAQTPWILNATLRDNILFGLPMDRDRYDRVIEACQLSHDLNVLEAGDLTEIGERGINLSGGQKQRVSVARAAYSNADTIILDDPLSALDPEVGKKLFKECIAGLMAGKTRLLVTNQIQFLPSCDKVVALGKRGVIEQGNYSDLMAAGGEVRRLLDEVGSKKGEKTNGEGNDGDDVGDKPTDEGESKEAPQPDEKDANEGNGPNKPAKEAKSLVAKEERAIGAVSWEVYRKYMAAGGSVFKFVFVFFVYVLTVSATLASTAWISFWTSDADYERNSEAFYLSMYAAIAIILGVFTYFRSFLLVRFGVAASETLHERLLESILQAPQSFFDTTPVGRILSRFSKDLYSIDTELSSQLDFFLSCAVQVTLSLSTILFVTPWFGVAVVPLGFIYITILNYFREVSRETKRLESISRSPVYAQFSETLGGLSTIRAYDQPSRFNDDFGRKVDQNIRAFYCNKAADRWLSVRLEILGATVAGLAAVFASNVTISGSVSGQESEDNFSSLAGLSLTVAISLTGLLNWGVRTFASLEAAMNACERVLYYSEKIPQEAPRTTDDMRRRAGDGSSFPDGKPSSVAVARSGGRVETVEASWPNAGAIALKNLRMRYRSDTPLVLRGLTVSIAGGERVGVVGRTGSGKSSLLLTLLRLVEPTLEDDDDAVPYEAPITIDGVDVLRIGLKELRSRMGIIPQNPVLFSGTIRTNIDPFDDYSDERIWDALEKCGMRESVESMPGMLNAAVSEYGENLSAGTRQMLVLGRALLKQCRVLLLDEATSSVDFETDRAIQRTIREAFPGCTVLTIAHRINTITDSDKILVIRDGEAEEFAPPGELLADANSAFSDIVRHAAESKRG